MEEFDFTDSTLHQDARGVIRVIGSRITLDIVVARYKRGSTPEKIQDSFPSLSLDQVNGVIAWYLNHTAEAEEYLARTGEGEEILKALQSDPKHQELRILIRQRWEQLQKERQEQLIEN